MYTSCAQRSQWWLLPSFRCDHLCVVQDTKWGKSEGCFTGILPEWMQPALLEAPRQAGDRERLAPPLWHRSDPGVTGSLLETWSQPQRHLPLPGALRIHRPAVVSL